MQNSDLLDSATLGERLLTTEEIKQQLKEWKAESEARHTLEEDDTQPLSKAEIAQKLFENRCLNVLRDTQMKAGYFFDLTEIKEAVEQLRREVGREAGGIADVIMSDFLVDNKHLFS